MDGSVENRNNTSDDSYKEKKDADLEINDTEHSNSTETTSVEVNSTEDEQTTHKDDDNETNKVVNVTDATDDDEKATKEINVKEPQQSESKEGDDKPEKSENTEDTPDVIDVFGTGEIMKERLAKGKGHHTRPNFGEICIFNVTTKLLDGTVLDQKSNFRCTLGHLEVVQALDLTLMLMEIGETAKVTSVSKFTTPKLDFNPALPEGTKKLVYEVELLDVDPIPNYYNMNSEELCKTLMRKKELGNFSMAKDDHTTALSTYNYAKEIIDQATNSIDTSIKVAIWNNMAACYLKMQNYSAVVDHTNKVLLLQPTNVKAMFRKGKALGQSGNYKEALEVLNKGIKIAAEKDLKLFHQAAAEFKHKMNKANEKERAMYKAMFDPDSKSSGKKKNKASSGLSWWTLGAAAAVVVALGAALIKINLSNS